MTSDLLDIFSAHHGIVCFVGAGGKKTSIYRLAAEHPGRVGVTATAHIERFPRGFPGAIIVNDRDTLVDQVIAATGHQRVAFAKSCEIPGRYAGMTCDELAHIYVAGRFDICLVKADGARGRLIKAPAEHEPPLPPAIQTVIPVVSAGAMGAPLSERIAHRLERVSAVTGARPGEILKPAHIARLLASDRGALKGVGGARVIPLINMVDDPKRERLAREAAETALALTDRFDRIILAAMKRPEPIVAIVRR